MKALPLIVCILLGTFLRGHKINQLTYTLDLDSTQTMVVHFTQQGAIDLLKSLHPELANETLFNLKERIPEFEAYFNANLQLRANGENVALKHLSDNLAGHDATITFALVPIPKNVTNIKVEVKAFTEVYPNTKNYVAVRHQGETYRAMLDKDTVTEHFKLAMDPSAHAGFSWWWGLVPFLIFGIWSGKGWLNRNFMQ